ncbi:2'-5' RNA ligase family protein [Patescibacteria group bacterium]|nr:2'-5' RNA ligase family protein [Patescibacteria group bacterium]MBU0963681.1 2'-5' RNA ligase family protein [Patescibacteria group bacterium]
MNKTIAVDIVLLPPKEIWEWAVQLSKEIGSNSERAEFLDNTHLPHITLVQAYVKQDDSEKINHTIEEILKHFSTLSLIVEEIISEGSWVAFRINKTEELMKLHINLVDAIQEYEQDLSRDAFILDSGEKVTDFAVNWVNNFRKNVSYNNFIPHITLGKNYEPEQMKPKNFTVDRLAVCHLGNHCTCRKILKEWRLSE